MIKHFDSDIDIDIGDRTRVLEKLQTTPASILRNGKYLRHASGVYVTEIPVDPYTGNAAIDYKAAEDRHYIKLDLLNVALYKQVRDEAHLLKLMQEPNWDRLLDREFFEKLIHVNAHYTTMKRMPEPINSIPSLAMFLAIIRPAKRHLIGKTWKEVAKTVWEKDADGAYAFKMSHSISYSQLVVVNMNLLSEEECNVCPSL